VKISELGSRDVRVIRPEEALAEAARRLQRYHIGALVVVDDKGWPIGIVTDRDIVCGQLEKKADLHCLIVGDVMTRDPVTLPADADVSRAVETMHAWGVRRAPVINRAGELVGIVTIDDLLPVLANQLTALGALIWTQPRCEGMRRVGAG
jgi:CBS domain-containing protein